MHPRHVTPASLLNANAQWAKQISSIQPEYFTEQAKGQSPKILWIGCANSRVPESVITASQLGDIFVHRNIANQFPPKDVSALAVLQYAVEHLGVQHIIVAGHTQCGGAAACYNAVLSSTNLSSEPIVAVPSHPPTDPINVWLQPLTSLAASLPHLLSLPTDEALSALVHENVKRQVAHLAQTDVVKHAWKEGKDVWVHGWVFEIERGMLVDLHVSKGRKSSGEKH